MTAVIEVKREANESNANLLRRFSKRVQTARVVKLAKSLKYRSRTQSHFKKKRSALVRLERRTEWERKKKFGQA